MPQATLGEQSRLEAVRRQEFSAAITARLQRARDLTSLGRPEEALSELRTTLNAVTSADQVDEPARRRLENQVRAQIGATESIEERVALERAELYRRQAADEARLRALGVSERNQDTIGVLMAEFDNLMAQGIFIVLANSGTGDIDSTLLPFTDARAAPSPPGPSTPGSSPPTARSTGPEHPLPLAGPRLRGALPLRAC